MSLRLAGRGVELHMWASRAKDACTGMHVMSRVQVSEPVVS